MVPWGSLSEIVDDVVRCSLSLEALFSMWSTAISGCVVFLSLSCVGSSTSISWHTKCIGNTWYVFPKSSEVIYLPFFTPGMPHMVCHLEMPVFQRQAIVACPIESTDFVIFHATTNTSHTQRSYLTIEQLTFAS